MAISVYCFVVFSIHITCIQSSPFERSTTVQIQNYDGPIFLSPSSCGERCDNTYQKPCSVMHHVGSKGCETDCSCVSKMTPVSVVPQTTCCWQGTVCCGAPVSGTSNCGTPQYDTACCLQAIPVCSQGTYLQPGAYYTFCPQTQACGSHQSYCKH